MAPAANNKSTSNFVFKGLLLTIRLLTYLRRFQLVLRHRLATAAEVKVASSNAVCRRLYHFYFTSAFRIRALVNIAVDAAHWMSLLLEHFFNLAGFLLDFAGEPFRLTLGLQLRVADDLAGFLFHFALERVNVALNLI